MKISVRCSSGEKYDVEFDPSITVADFKVVLSKIAHIEAGKQRLIYRGKIMKDPHTMNSYGTCCVVKNILHTIFQICKMGMPFTW